MENKIEPGLSVPSLLLRARDFLSLFPWCEGVIELAPEFEVGDVIGVYRANFLPSGGARSPAWILVGQLPPTVLPMENNWTLAETLENHILNLGAWAQAIEEGRMDMHKFTPVLRPFSNERVPPTLENAAMVRSTMREMRSLLDPILSTRDTLKLDGKHRWPVIGK